MTKFIQIKPWNLSHLQNKCNISLFIKSDNNNDVGPVSSGMETLAWYNVFEHINMHCITFSMIPRNLVR